MALYDDVSVLPPSLNDVFNINDICLPEYSFNCDFHTHKDVTLDVSSISTVLSSIAFSYISSSIANISSLYSAELETVLL